MRLSQHYINLILTALCVIVSVSLMAQPMLNTAITLDGNRVFRDKKKSNLFYAVPPAYGLKSGADGKPSLTLLQMRYTGTVASNDNGKIRNTNIMQFTVAADANYNKTLGQLKTKLLSLYPGAELRPLPVQRFSSLLVFAGTNAGDTSRILQAGIAELSDEDAAVNNSYWNERVISFRLSDFDAQLVETALKNQQAAMSFAYAYGAVFSDTLPDQLVLAGMNSLERKEITDQLKNDVNKDSTQQLLMIRADAVPVKADITKWPTVIQKVDINEKMPARFPVFSIYCFDFSGNMRDDLFAKKIEIKAISVNGSEVQLAYTFKRAQPDQYAKSIRFPYAVRFDKPYYYRVREIDNNGEMVISEWIERKVWTENINITSPPEKTVRKQPVEEL